MLRFGGSFSNSNPLRLCRIPKSDGKTSVYMYVCVCYAHWMAVDVLTQVHYGDAPSLWEEITSPLREVQSSHYGAHIHVSFVIFWGKMHHNVLNLMVNMWVKCKTEQIVVRIWESSSSWSPWSLCNLPKSDRKTSVWARLCVCATFPLFTAACTFL